MTTAFLLIGLPIIAGLIALVWKSHVGRRVLLVAVSLVHLATTISLWVERPAIEPHAWLGVDDAGLLFLTITSILFLAASIYTVGYLPQEYRGSCLPPSPKRFFSVACCHFSA